MVGRGGSASWHIMVEMIHDPFFYFFLKKAEKRERKRVEVEEKTDEKDFPKKRV